MGDAHSVSILVENNWLNFFHSSIRLWTYRPALRACVVASCACARTNGHRMCFPLTPCLLLDTRRWGREVDQERVDFSPPTRAFKNHLSSAPLLRYIIAAFMDPEFPVWIINDHATSPDKRLENLSLHLKKERFTLFWAASHFPFTHGSLLWKLCWMCLLICTRSPFQAGDRCVKLFRYVCD